MADKRDDEKNITSNLKHQTGNLSLSLMRKRKKEPSGSFFGTSLGDLSADLVRGTASDGTGGFEETAGDQGDEDGCDTKTHGHYGQHRDELQHFSYLP